MAGLVEQRLLFQPELWRRQTLGRVQPAPAERDVFHAGVARDAQCYEVGGMIRALVIAIESRSRNYVMNLQRGLGGLRATVLARVIVPLSDLAPYHVPARAEVSIRPAALLGARYGGAVRVALGHTLERVAAHGIVTGLRAILLIAVPLGRAWVLIERCAANDTLAGSPLPSANICAFAAAPTARTRINVALPFVVDLAATLADKFDSSHFMHTAIVADRARPCLQ